jgi:hypothetical protein
MYLVLIVLVLLMVFGSDHEGRRPGRAPRD